MASKWGLKIQKRGKRTPASIRKMKKSEGADRGSGIGAETKGRRMVFS